MPGPQLVDQALPLIDRNIKSDGGSFDQVKLCRHGGEGEQTALDSLAERIQHPVDVQSRASF